MAMRGSAKIIVLVVLGVCATASGQSEADRVRPGFSIMAGADLIELESVDGRVLGEDAWLGGVIADFPISQKRKLALEFGGSYAYDIHEISPNVDQGFEIFEGFIGLRIYDTRHGRFHTYFGAGVLYDELLITNDNPSQPFDDDTNSFGGYARAGVRYGIGAISHVGVDVRYRFGTEFELWGESESFDADGLQAVLLFGWDW
jgi:hypothetical protein